jgi:Uma2 family endonuclease
MVVMKATLISVGEYLATAYRPDCDYVDGLIEERNVGQKDHSKVQRNLLIWFWTHFQSTLSAMPELRLQIGPSRFRIPDVSVVLVPEPEEQVLTSPPFIVIEVLSPEDTLARLQQRVDDYITMGVHNIWVIDPASRRSWCASRQGLLEVLDGRLRTDDPTVELPVADLF